MTIRTDHGRRAAAKSHGLPRHPRGFAQTGKAAFAFAVRTRAGAWGSGIAFTLIIALLGYGLACLPGLDRAGQLACSILLAVLYRQLWGYPEKLRAGIRFSSQQLLRLAIILFGLKLNIGVVLQQGPGLLLRDAAVIVFSILATRLLAEWLKGDPSLSLLLGIGTGVCGAAAIAAVSPILQSKEEDTAIGAGIIALVGTLFAVAYTVIRPFLPLSGVDYGIWSGASLHELAHVALAAEPAGPDALAVALLAKLGRVLLLIPLSLLLMVWMKRTGRTGTDAKITFPWFLLGFIAMSCLGSFLIGKYILIPQAVMNGVSSLTTFLLAMAMAGLGLNVDLRQLRAKALRPLFAMLTASLLLSLLTLATL